MIINSQVTYILKNSHIEELFYKEYIHHLNTINQIVVQSKEVLEGNIFYIHESKNLQQLYPYYKTKRKSVSLLSNLTDVIVEIGFNAGHSALLMLTANKDLIYKSIDLNFHSYTTPCYDYLKEQFGNRIELSVGSSLDVLPNVFNIYPEIKDKKISWIIDGGHSVETANEDMKNVLSLAKDDDIILFDDTEQGSPLRELINLYILSSKITILLDENSHVFFKKTK